MKYLTLFFHSLPFFITAQTAPSIQWQKALGGTHVNQRIRSATSDGGYLVAGHSMSKDGDYINHGGGITGS
jgi:hypothetical protein